MAEQMTPKRRIVVAMSGGVDSSTAAALLVEAGHEVIGVAMKTHRLAAKSNRACCTPDDMRDARQVADQLGIPFYVLAYEDLFQQEVVAPFVAAYKAGLTPNPCIACNDRVKFRPLLERARLLGADLLATGHYARLRHEADGSTSLLRAVDVAKDQSYFLYRLQQDQLAMLTFPLGEMDKLTVRAHARRLGLRLADKSESQDICFVGPRGYAATVEQHAGHRDKAPGGAGAGDADADATKLADAAVENTVVDLTGRVIGQHGGIHHFTLGQRRGIGPCLHRASPEPVYVTHLDPVRGRVQVGPLSALSRQEVRVGNLSWTRRMPEVGEEVRVQQRHRETPKAATVVAFEGGALTLRFVAATLRGAPGQAAVLTVGDELLGGGTLLACPPPVPAEDAAETTPDNTQRRVPRPAASARHGAAAAAAAALPA